MTAVQSQLEELEANTPRRMNRRRSSRISMTSAMAIRSVVAKMSGDPARMPLFDNNSDDDDDDEEVSGSSSISHEELKSFAAQPPQSQVAGEKTIGTSTMSFSELIPKEPIRVDVPPEEATCPTPVRTTLRRPSGNAALVQDTAEDSATEKNNMLSSLHDSNRSILSRDDSMGLMDLADEESFCGDSHHGNWDSMDGSSAHQMAFSRTSSLGMLSTSDDTVSDDDDSESDESTGPQRALQFLPPELNTLLNLSPEHPTCKLTLPDSVAPKIAIMPSLSDTESKKKTEKDTHNQPKLKRSSKAERVERRKRTVDHHNSSSVRSTRTSGSKVTTTKEEGRRSEHRSSKTSRRRTSTNVEMMDSSSRRRASSKRRSNTEMKDTPSRRRVDVAMDGSSRRRNEMADVSDRRSSRPMDSSSRRSKAGGSGHDKPESSTRRSRRPMTDSSSIRDSLKDSSAPSRSVRRGSSAKPRPRKLQTFPPAEREVIRRSSYCLPSEVPEELRHPPMRSFSSTNDMQQDSKTATKSKRIPSTAAAAAAAAASKTGSKPSTSKSARQSASRDVSRGDGGSRRVGRRTSARSPALKGPAQPHQRRSHSCAPKEEDSVPAPPNLSRRKSSDESRARLVDERTKTARRRHTSDEDDDDSDVDGENVLIVKPLQLVFEPVAAESDRAIISCQKASFPSHYKYGDLAKLNSSQRSMRMTGSKAKKEGQETLGGSHHSQKAITAKSALERAARSGSFSNLNRAAKQFKQQKASGRNRSLHESFMF